MKKPTLREMFTIPNILSYFRILLIPLFVYLYFKAETPPSFFGRLWYWGYPASQTCSMVKFARRFNQITELGILLDPVADKLTEGRCGALPDDTVSLGRCACSAVCT